MATIIGLIISAVVIGILMSIFTPMIYSLNKKVVKNKYGKIDFQKTDVFFYWSRWDTINVILAVYICICMIVLFILLTAGETINNPIVQFLAHQTVVLSIVTFSWFISKNINVYKGIKERWLDAERE